MSGITSFPIPRDPLWIQRLLRWADQQYQYFAYFQNNEIPYPHKGYEHRFFSGTYAFSLEEAEAFYGKKTMIGVIAYDYKNQIENLSSNNPEVLDFQDNLFFLPELQIQIEGEKIIIHHDQAEKLLQEILGFPLGEFENPAVLVQAMTDHTTYLTHIRAIQDHIREGDIYEMNFCMAFVFQNQDWDPISGFLDLMKISPMPFSAIFRAQSKYLICASPERFLKKAGNSLIAQPIKGTLKRGRIPEEDLLFREMLQQSEKERAENLMIVDLMRNDLSKISLTGSVSVEKLFAVYPFPRVWQMISTIVSVAKKDLSLKELIHATFPMGSMTGAPKIKCMELIEKYENFKRGWFSGALGVIEADGNMDLNVIIRSVVFDQKSGKGFFAVGSAITIDADAEYEYEECYLKASAILEMLRKV